LKGKIQSLKNPWFGMVQNGKKKIPWNKSILKELKLKETFPFKKIKTKRSHQANHSKRRKSKKN